MGTDTLQRVRRALRKPPHVVLRRIAHELIAESERIRAPLTERTFGTTQLLRATDASAVDDLWERVRSRAPFPPPPDVDYGADAILEAAERAVRREVSLLGSGPRRLDRPIDWHTDFTSGRTWPPRFFRSINYGLRGSTGDVKVPWELSRAQWLIPVGQAYVLTRDERYAEAARDVISEWISANPFAASVNWAVTMEVALRIVSWTWLVGALGGSDSWGDAAFRRSFLRALYLHGSFTERHLERSDVNGNHYTADASGLAIAGQVFGAGSAPRRWSARGWAILCEELPRQVHSDGIDFEASTAYHRLVAELFMLPALYREQLGIDVPEWYRERVRAMARFIAAYTRPDATAPWWGDADDARALPLAIAPADDHTHIVEVVRTAWGGIDRGATSPAAHAEARWLLGRDSAVPSTTAPGPVAFRSGGVYVLAAERDHVFIDCGPVGLAGRGGHGHNDCLHVDAYLDGVHVLADPGSYVYTGSWEWRDAFRRTAAHNTPQIDGAEQNRFVPGSLWLLHDDARPELHEWLSEPPLLRFVGSHSGYERLSPPVRPVRTVELDTTAHRLVVLDQFEGEGLHDVAISFQLARSIDVELTADRVVLQVDGRSFAVTWAGPEWTLTVEDGSVSPSYGVKLAAPRLTWSRSGHLAPLSVQIEPYTTRCD